MTFFATPWTYCDVWNLKTYFKSNETRKTLLLQFILYVQSLKHQKIENISSHFYTTQASLHIIWMAYFLIYPIFAKIILFFEVL